MSDQRKLVQTKEPGVFKRGDSYIVRWKHRGKSHKRYFSSFAEAREFKRGLSGAAKQPTTGLTVADYYEGWIDSYRGRTVRGLESTTRDEYRRSFRLHVLPFRIAREKVRDVTSRDISDWFTELEREGVKPPSIRKAKAAMSAFLATAAQAGDIHSNPVMGVRYVPQNPQPKAKPHRLTIAEANKIIAAVPAQWKVFFQLMAESGLRVGELLGLTWANVHLGDDPHLEVVEQVYRGKRKRLKTEGSERPVPLSQGMAQALTDWKANWQHVANLGEPGGVVFPSQAGTPLNYSNVYNRVLQPALAEVGLADKGIGFHHFRKLAGSVLSGRAGKSLVQVQKWLGHAQLATTLAAYQHELDDGLGGAEGLDELWGHPGATEGPQTAAEAKVSDDGQIAD